MHSLHLFQLKWNRPLRMLTFYSSLPKGFLILCLLAFVCFANQSCVPMMVSYVENIDKRMDSLQNLRKQYITQSRNFDRAEGLEMAFFADRAKKYDSLARTSAFPLRFQISKIDSDSFPSRVVANALVFDTSGKYIAGLAPPYAKDSSWRKYWASVVDSCRGQASNITNFTVEEVRNNNNRPYAIYFVLDHSGSMASLAELLQQSVKKVLYAIKKEDIVGIVKFGSKVYEEVPATNNQQDYRSKFQTNGTETSRYGASTAMYQAVAFAARKLDSAGKGFKKVIILFSDGSDNESKISADSCIQLCRKSKVEVYSIAYLAYSLPDKSLPQISRATNGRFYELFSKNEFPFVFRDIYTTLNNYYRISYAPPPCLGKHFVTAGLDILPGRNAILYSGANYDKSVLDEFAPVGTVVLANIEFDFGSAGVKPESMHFVEEIGAAMAENPKMQIRIAGHTDDVGSDEANQKLSLERAMSVRNELIKLGIDAGRIQTVGLGESKPIAPNDTDENRKRNRRTEFEILKK